ncbi:MAG: histidine kinase [Herpetosiphonaceae bacterium]|nr:MAG: histidine kinase [Herpetosiphonaceae bacterium]
MPATMSKKSRGSKLEHLKVQYDRLQALFCLSAELRADRDPATLYAQTTHGLLELLGASVILIWLAAPQRRLNISYAAGIDLPPGGAASLRGMQVRAGEGPVGQVLADGQPRLIEGADAHRAAFGHLGRRREAFYRKLRQCLPEQFDTLAVGMYDQGQLIGAVEIFARPHILSEDDIASLQLFADRFAAALTVSHMYSELVMQRTRLAAFDAVVTAISIASDLQELLLQSLLVVINVSGASGGGIVLVAPGGTRLDLAVQQGMPDSETALLNHALVQGGPLEEATYYGQPMDRTIEAESGELTRAVIPLLAGGTVVGALLLYGQPQLFGNRLDWPSLMAIGSQIGIAIANARLYEESQRERRRLATVIDSMADGVAICDAEGRLVLANEAAAHMIDLAALQPRGSLPAHGSEARLYDLDGIPINPSMSPLARALSGEIFHDYRLLVRQPRGEVVLSFSGAPLRSETMAPPEGQADGGVVLFRDVTIQRQLEQAKDEFLAVAAHELRSPLASIKGYADLLLRRELRTGADERDIRGVRVLSQQVDHLVRLVDNLLDLSRLDAGRLTLHWEEVNLRQVVEMAAIQFRTIAPTHHIVVECDDEIIICRCDVLRIRQVITNLLSNAIRYSPGNTQVTITLRQQDSEIYLAVADQGPGVPPAYRERLFNRYYRVPGVKRQGPGGEGLGLGLYLSREIVLLHGGRIWVEDAPGGGALFVITLPSSEQGQEDREQVASKPDKEIRYALQR